MGYKWFVLDINPEPWAIGALGVARKGGKLIPYVAGNAQLKAFQEAVREELNENEMTEGKFALRFCFWRNRAEYQTHQARTHRKHEADLTNMQKATEDALQKILFDNDKDVLDCHTTVVEQGPDVKGRIVIGFKLITDELSVSDLPQEVWDFMDMLDSEPESDSNEWPPRGKDAPF
jgi:Holliday junction resolvase RusA-like endonuclease